MIIFRIYKLVFDLEACFFNFFYDLIKVMQI